MKRSIKREIDDLGRITVPADFREELEPCCSDLGYCKDCPEVTTCEECWNIPVEEDE